MKTDRIQDAVSDLRQGRMVILIDQAGEALEAHLLLVAEKVTPDAVNFMASEARGLVCLPMSPEALDRLKIPLMASKNRRPDATAFCVSIEARRDVTTGISAGDRAVTILTAIDPQSTPADIVMPGHLFPVRARRGGVLQRAGKAEASVDLARIAGCSPAAVTCQILDDEGSVAGPAQVEAFARQHELRLVSVVDLIQFRMVTERLVERISETRAATARGRFRLILYRNRLDSGRHLALVLGDVGDGRPTMVRMHAASVLADVFGVDGFPDELEASLAMIQREGRGVLVYLTMLDRDGRLEEEMRRLTGQPPSPSRSAFREFGVGAQILSDLGLSQIRLLTNHPKIIGALEGFNLKIVDQIPIEAGEKRRDKRGTRPTPS